MGTHGDFWLHLCTFHARSCGKQHFGQRLAGMGGQLVVRVDAVKRNKARRSKLKICDFISRQSCDPKGCNPKVTRCSSWIRCRVSFQDSSKKIGSKHLLLGDLFLHVLHAHEYACTYLQQLLSHRTDAFSFQFCKIRLALSEEFVLTGEENIT